MGKERLVEHRALRLHPLGVIRVAQPTAPPRLHNPLELLVLRSQQVFAAGLFESLSGTDDAERRCCDGDARART